MSKEMTIHNLSCEPYLALMLIHKKIKLPKWQQLLNKSCKMGKMVMRNLLKLRILTKLIKLILILLKLLSLKTRGILLMRLLRR